MKTLLLLRHAKSSRDDSSLRDFDRPLTDRGKDDAKLTGRELRKKEISVDAIVSSPAKRARRTAELFAKAAELPTEPSLDERIYEASAHQLLGVVSELAPSSALVLLVGHNPRFEELLHALTGDVARMPTASLACIDLNVNEWREVNRSSGSLRWLVTPKSLKGRGKTPSPSGRGSG